ncbi:glucokinase [Piscinibacterium candidicorallinum]|uniref:Glucokinase n=1 Tax=Piscinibacterium candidicorallinum TaxID=1793872 RepID=A0ABV7H333_9BURK
MTIAALPWLVADIGGTNARFGWVDAPGAPVAHVRSLSVAEHAQPDDAAAAYLRELSAAMGQQWRAPRHAAFAVASPITGDRVAFTNSPWQFSRSALQASLGLDSLAVVNDFEALALALPQLTPAQLIAQGPLPTNDGPMAVVGPGTGLGVAGLIRHGGQWVAIPGEGGHATLAAGNDFEAAVIAAARRQFEHVSAERLLSGIGLPVLHGAVAQVLLGEAPEAPLSTEDIVARGLAGSDPVCRKTLDTFCALLGSFAGNVALTLGARSGVYIAGGIVPRLGERFFASAFRERFEAKGRYRDYLRAVPVAVVAETHVALAGAAAVIAGQRG